MTDTNLGGAEGFPPAETDEEIGGGANIARAWQTSPMFRVTMILLPVIAVGALALGVMRTKQTIEAPTISRTGSGYAGGSLPEQPSSPAYEDALREAERQRVEAAAGTGESTIPLPIGKTIDDFQVSEQERTKTIDPLSEWRTVVGEVEKQEAAARAAAPLPLPVASIRSDSPEIEQLAAQMQSQMQMLFGAWTPQPYGVIDVTTGPLPESEKQAEYQTVSMIGQTAAQETPEPVTLISAGDIVYAETLLEANSDVPGPVLVRILSGALAGARAIGSFQVADDKMVLQFSRAIKDGKEYPIQAYAIDPETTLPAMASRVDQHYFGRIVLPVSASFVEGFASAAATTSTVTTDTTSGSVVQETSNLDTREELLKGVEQAAGTISGLIMDQVPDGPTVYIDVGTPMGMMFMQTVTEPPAPVTEPMIEREG
ncbi:MAG: DotG/IcmE/VirB10 family protein [Pseudomonadota bacterium]|nr:DotG/IcmE/VirB10 family protein [Pseudomonadota bacterium]